MTKFGRIARRSAFVGWVAGVAACLLAACGSPDLTDTSGNGALRPPGDGREACNPGVAGCACDTSGATAACGHIVYRSGDYVTCSEGSSTCQGGSWGPCEGDTIVTKSLAGATLGGSGLRVLSATATCPDPCDPNGCVQTSEVPTDVDAAGVAITDGGLTIQPTIVTTGGVEGGTGDGATCQGLQCQVAYCGTTNGTTVTGKVFDPAGVNPLYNAWVYVPVDPNAALPPFTPGVTCDTCAGAGTFNAVAVAQTAPDGTFTLTNVPNGTNIPVVVQMGKWRRKTTLASVSACTNNAVADGTLRLPRNRFDGDGNTADIPEIAFVSGSADPFECMLLKAGIDPNEFGSLTLNSNRRIHYYDSPDSRGNSIDPAFGNVVTGDVLWNNPANLALYDLVILACEGAEYTADRSVTGFPNLVSYAAGGGRVFLSHYSYVWMKYNTPWQGVPASWGPASTIATQDPLTATIVTSGFSKGQAFQQWLFDVGASTTLGQLTLNQARQDTTLPLSSSVQSWMTATNTAYGALNPPTYSPSFTYNTPLGAAAASQCGRVVFSDFHVATSALTSGNSCTSNAGCGYGSTCSGAGILGTCTQPSCTPSTASTACGDSHFSCAGGLAGKCGCSTNTDCSAMGAGTCIGATTSTCSVASCYQNSDCVGSNTCSGATLGTCVMNGTCTKGRQCASGSCQGGVCQNPPSCDPLAPACGSRETCSGGKVGTCTCNQASDCSSIGAGSCPGGATGTCSTATCYSGVDCTSGTRTCSGGQPGTCAPNSCTSNANCTSFWRGSERCAGGTCSGCYSAADCPWSGATCVGGVAPGTCSGNSNNFPYACAQGPLTPQEAALEFELFDLSSCVSPDTAPPPAPPMTTVTYKTVRFTEDFTSSCAPGTHVVWRQISWQDTIPATASIAFSAQTVDPPADGGPPDYTNAQVVPVYTATSTGAFTALLDVSGDAGSGAFQTANPVVTSKTDLRVTITLQPTSDQMAAPVLANWQVQSDCMPSE